MLDMVYRYIIIGARKRGSAGSPIVPMLHPLAKNKILWYTIEVNARRRDARMARFRINTIEGFDYGGQVDTGFYERNVEEAERRVRFHGMDGLSGLNWELGLMNSRYRRKPSEQLAGRIRAMHMMVEELAHEVA